MGWNQESVVRYWRYTLNPTTASTGGFIMNKTTLEDTATDQVAQRLKSQFAPAYLTLASII